MKSLALDTMERRNCGQRPTHGRAQANEPDLDHGLSL